MEARKLMVRLRGISEITSAAILTLIVLIVGGFVVARILGVLEHGLSEAQNRISMIEREMGSTLAVMAAYKPSDTIARVILVSGEYPVKLTAVYVNDELWAANCLVDGSPVDGYTMGPETVAVLECTGVPLGTVSVKVVYEGGEVVALAG